MIRPIWFLPVMLMTALAGYLGFRMGQNVSETYVIETYADYYASKHGGNPTDCVGRPSANAAVFIEVACVGPSGDGYVFDVNDRGRLLATRVIAQATA